MRLKQQWQHQVRCAMLALTWAGCAAAQAPDEDELALAYGDKTSVSIATGSQLPVSRAPSAATVITAHEIESMGATDLDQVLESVPGLHVATSSLAGTPIYSFRGIFTGYNPQVLMLVNGIPITNAFAGNRGLIWGGMPVENVARIEVIRGPGSAVYGADAFSGVINIITKTASDIKGTEYGIRLGSFNSRDGWFQQGGKLGPLEAAFYLRAGQTDGQRGVVQQDLQSKLDTLFGTQVSLAPGSFNASRKALDARADLSYKQWRFRAGYQQRKVGTGAGLADSLDPNGRAPASKLNLDLTYQNDNWAPNWSLAAVAGYSDIKEYPGNPAYMLFPPGAFGGAFPNGMIGNPGHSERHSHASLSAFYTGFLRHRLRIGTGHRLADLYATSETKNFQLLAGGIPAPLGGIVDVSNTAQVYLTPHQRKLTYVFVQDEWALANDWTLTAGVRHDRYSDFGKTTNPRLALVWAAAYNVTVKAMHGRAFRAPSFVEQYNINNPVSVGNPNLRPETISTSELAFTWQASQALQTNLNLFRYRMRDIIQFVPDATGATANNTGSQSGRGLELDATWDISSNLRLAGIASLQHSTDDVTDQDAGLAPRQRLFVRADWRFAPRWQFGATVNHVAERKRQPGDNRPPIADYSTLDLSLRYEKFAGNWVVKAMALNLFNRDAREPSLAPGNIPFDLPLPGRALYIQFQHVL